MGYTTYEVRVYPSGDRAWYFEGKLHRTDGPAVEYANGYRAWWVDGKLHRTDGPAVEYANGYRAWWVDGKLHRTDGPAVENSDGYRAWWVDGVKMAEVEHTAKVAGCARKIVEIDGRKYKLQEA